MSYFQRILMPSNTTSSCVLSLERTQDRLTGQNKQGNKD